MYLLVFASICKIPSNTGRLSSSHFLVDFINFYTNYSCEGGRVHSPVLHPTAMAVLNKTETESESVLFPLTSNFQFHFAI